MLHFTQRTHWAFFAIVLLGPAGAAQAQAPVITSVIPMANTRAAARSGSVTVNFSQPLTAASAGALKVFSAQRGGLRSRGATPATVSGNVLSWAPSAYDFRPGETVQYTVTTAAAGSGGALARGRVGQFTTAVGGTGRGGLVADVPTPLPSAPTKLAVGDLDNDGDLDFVTANLIAASASVRLNNGNGVFGGTLDLPASGSVTDVALGDLDDNGTLDLVVLGVATGPPYLGAARVYLNSGSGFVRGTDVSLGINSAEIKLGDVNGDGVLDLVSANAGAASVSIRLGTGTGGFGAGPDVPVGIQPLTLALGDLDNDGDLDLAVATFGSGQTDVCLNNGLGTFSYTQSLRGGNHPEVLTMSDVDGDSDLDLVVTDQYAGGAIFVHVNNGQGNFTLTLPIAVGGNPYGLAVGDLNADGRPDLLVSDQFAGQVRCCLNLGSGAFGPAQSFGAGLAAQGLALGDADNDDDLDVFVANGGTAHTVTLLRDGQVLGTRGPRLTGGLALFPNPTPGPATLTGAAPHAPVAVLDALGRVLLTATTDATGAARLALPAGLYVVRCGGQAARLAVE